MTSPTLSLSLTLAAATAVLMLLALFRHPTRTEPLPAIAQHAANRRRSI